MRTFLAVLAALVVHEQTKYAVRKAIKSGFQYMDGRAREAHYARERGLGKTAYGWSGGRWWRWQCRLGFRGRD